ncbi:MAG: hypothetical protein AVDCRST_MAG87-3098, partial [uncultured Thermomicrobiales bacterium]
GRGFLRRVERARSRDRQSAALAGAERPVAIDPDRARHRLRPEATL